ncbi:MAG: lycopene beta-cyclase CrtY, partial [Deltaproteobacteria bacterium]|nr:lycopene beta-cyclase CrtY [Deltaproteobacteria bacterium]
MIYDVIFVGGGLSAGLALACLKHRRPELQLLVLEKDPHLGGNHTWSFHPSDVDQASDVWLGPLISRRWARHEVRFPEYRREIASGYCSIRSEAFDSYLRRRFGDAIQVNASVRHFSREHVELEDGTRFQARCVIDARGQFEATGPLGYQKFVGCFLKVREPHRMKHPVLMDATVEQIDGYRFVYVLPWDETTLLVEDTCYSESPALDDNGVQQRIEAYARQNDWGESVVVHEERGVLPIPLRDKLSHRKDGVAQIGMAARRFHPTTGFSLPNAVRTAELIAGVPEPGRMAQALRASAAVEWRRGH